MLFQFHHQDKKPPHKTEFVSQFEVPDDTYKNGMARPIIQAELKRISEEFPPPEGKIWMLCRESSEHFIMTREV